MKEETEHDDGECEGAESSMRGRYIRWRKATAERAGSRNEDE